MNRRFLFTWICIAWLGFLLPYCSNEPIMQEGILVYLPQKNELGNWSPMGKPQTAEGEDLILLINGGAEIYFEYGFKRAVFQSYTFEDDKTINVEIYEMEDPVSAYGAYTFKTGKKGRDLDIGNESLLENYYLNFWKGNFVVTLIGFNTDTETQAGLMTLGKVIDAKIVSQGQRPPLVDYLPQDDLKKSGITYLQGQMGLFNRYEFSRENIFGLKEGVLGDYGDYRIFIFHYNDNNECLSWFQNAKAHIKADSKFGEMKSFENGFSVRDSKNQTVSICIYQKYILVSLGEEESKARGALQSIKDGIQKEQVE